MNSLTLVLLIIILVTQIFISLAILKISEDISNLYNLIRVMSDDIIEEVHKNK